MVKLIKYLIYIGKLSALKQAESMIKEVSISAHVSYTRASANSDDTGMSYFGGQLSAYEALVYGIQTAIKDLEKEYKEGD